MARCADEQVSVRGDDRGSHDFSVCRFIHHDLVQRLAGCGVEYSRFTSVADQVDLSIGG